MVRQNSNTGCCCSPPPLIHPFSTELKIIFGGSATEHFCFLVVVSERKKEGICSDKQLLPFAHHQIAFSRGKTRKILANWLDLMLDFEKQIYFVNFLLMTIIISFFSARSNDRQKRRRCAWFARFLGRFAWRKSRSSFWKGEIFWKDNFNSDF